MLQLMRQRGLAYAPRATAAGSRDQAAKSPDVGSDMACRERRVSHCAGAADERTREFAWPG